MKKEYLFITIMVGLLLAYLLEATVDPLSLKLATPYEYLNLKYASQFPFTAATIIIRSIAIFSIPLLFTSFFQGAYIGKAIFLVIFSALEQLYSLQEIATGTTLLPLEWSLALTLSGLILLIPTLFYLLQGIFQKTKSAFVSRLDNLGSTDENN